MRSAKGDGELTKILVERHQHPSLFMRESEDLLVAGILVPIASPLCIVTSPGKGFLGLPPDTGVEKDFHEPVWRSKGSMRSWPTTRFAYTRQAWTSSGSSQG